MRASVVLQKRNAALLLVCAFVPTHPIPTSTHPSCCCCCPQLPSIASLAWRVDRIVGSSLQHDMEATTVHLSLTTTHDPDRPGDLPSGPGAFEFGHAPVPHTAHRTPHTAHRTPHTAHRTPHTAHRTPHTAPPAPRTLHPHRAATRVRAMCCTPIGVCGVGTACCGVAPVSPSRRQALPRQPAPLCPSTWTGPRSECCTRSCSGPGTPWHAWPPLRSRRRCLLRGRRRCLLRGRRCCFTSR
jgi:hypothetical protein